MSKNRTGLGVRSSPGITRVVKLEKGRKADTEKARQSICASPATHAGPHRGICFMVFCDYKNFGAWDLQRKPGVGCFRELSLVRKKEKHV